MDVGKLMPAPMATAEITFGSGHKAALHLHVTLNADDPSPDEGGGFQNTANAVAGKLTQEAYAQLKDRLDAQLAEMFKP